MTENQQVLKERLQKLLTQKKSKKFYAERLGIDEREVTDLLEHIRLGQEAILDVSILADYVCDLEDVIVKLDEDIRAGKGELTAKFKDEIKTLDELIEKCKIDTNKWNIDRYVQNYWGNDSHPHWQVKAFLSKKTTEENFQKNFLSFLETYKPIKEVIITRRGDKDIDYPLSCLIINKQDEHLNKFDIYGDNSIKDRFIRTFDKIRSIVVEAATCHKIDEIVYILGSDQFNSEWTGLTTKGTPQSNLMPYQEAFQEICDYEVGIINLLSSQCNKLKVLYVAGNHDEYVGWHLIHWLQAVNSNNLAIEFDISPRYTKYIRYGKSAIMFNHGDAIKPAKLANMFPIQFKEEWSKADNFYIFTGDKHHEVSIDFNGIKFYQLPALSGSKSLWDDKNGHVYSPAELTAFLLEEKQGMVNIYKQKL